jgi:hypothetical protein
MRRSISEMMVLRISGRSRILDGVHYGAGISGFERHWVAFGLVILSPEG